MSDEAVRARLVAWCEVERNGWPMRSTRNLAAAQHESYSSAAIILAQRRWADGKGGCLPIPANEIAPT